MGLATHNRVGGLRLCLSATAASAVLYSAVVLFGVGSPPSVTLDVESNRPTSVVRISERSDVGSVSGSVKKLPQASPEPGRPRHRVRPHQPRRPGVESTSPPTPATVESPAPLPVPPRATESASPSVKAPSTVPVAAPLPSVTVPTVPAPELPALLPQPTLPVPPVLLPVPLALNLPG
jgi:hypothetical protein